MARRRESSSAGKWIAIVIIMFVIMLCLAAYLIMSGNGNSNPVTKGIQREVTKKAVDKVVIEKTGGTSLGEIESQMSEDDAETFNDIVDKYSESGLVSEALSIYSANGGDVGATAEELRDKVDPEDIETLKELYSRYAE